jgi:hypothetical protein
MTSESEQKDQAVSQNDTGVKRRGLLRFGTLITALTGASAISAISANSAQAGPGDKTPPSTYVPISEKGAPAGVATLDAASKIPPAQLPDLSTSYAAKSVETTKLDVTTAATTYVGRRDPYISALDYGAVADGNLSTGAGTDNTSALTAAVASAIAANKPLLIPAGVYKTLDNISFVGARVYGHGVNKTYIMCGDVTKDVVTVGGGGAYLADMTIQHFAIPDGSVVVPNGVGVRVHKLGDRSVLQRLHIRNVTSGIYSYEPVNDTTNYIYSTRFSDIRVERFSHSAAYLRGYAAGNTGCVFENLYAQNGNGDGTYVTSDYGWFFGEFDECSVNQLNVEWGYYATGISIVGCQSFRVTNTHFEQYRAKGASFSSHWNIVGSATRSVTISGVTYKNCVYDIANIPDYALVRIQDANSVLYENAVSTGATVKGSPNLVKYRFAPAVEGANVIPRNVRQLDGSFGTDTFYQTALTTPGVRAMTTTLGSSMYEEGGGMRWKTPNSTILTLGGNVTSASSNYTITAGDLFVLATGGAGGITVTLPAATKGGRVTIKKVDSGAGAITIAPTSSETIDGATVKSLAAQYDKIAVVSDGTSWFVL